jgi:hypothetical protein
VGLLARPEHVARVRVTVRARARVRVRVRVRVRARARARVRARAKADQAARLGLAVGCGEGLDPLHGLGAVVESVDERALAHLVRLKVVLG